MSASTMLTECEAAISRVMNAKAYTAADMNVQREELKNLREWRSELKKEINRDTNGGIEVSGIIATDN
jgi:hypothetical protein